MKKKKDVLTPLFILAALFLAFLSQSCSFFKNTRDCGKFKTGDFTYNFRGPQGNFSFFISRNDSIQTETNSQTGDISILAVSWTDECNYELRLIESTTNYPDSIIELRKSMVIKNEIVSWTDDYFLFNSKQDNSDFVLFDTLWIKK